MADSADLVVLGANFGSGSKGGMMSTFLMGITISLTVIFLICVAGVHDPKTNRWKTVCKVCINSLSLLISNIFNR